jgi:abortive infection alpha-like protein
MSTEGPEPNEERDTGDTSVVEALPAIARMAAVAWWRSASWSVQNSLRVGNRLAHAATDPGSATRLLDEVSGGLRTYAREFLGIADLDSRVRQLTPTSGGRGPRWRGGPGQGVSLRAQGAELLLHAADVNYEDGAHPAYGRILTELAPDEARMLRLLAVDGAQPSVDVRAGNLIGIGSQLVAPGLNMIGAQAGVRHRDRVPAYLNNLYRLGLIWFSHEPLQDPISYQVLEAQPEVLQAIKETTRAKTIQRSIHLTPFGQDFVEVCLPLELDEVEALTAGEE